MITEVVVLVPKIIAALIIWWVGKHIINLAVKIIRSVPGREGKVEAKVSDLLAQVVSPLGRFLLVLIVLDYLGIGRTLIGAFVSGLAFAIAIALGLAVGRAIEPDAEKLVKTIRKHLQS